MHRDVVRIQDGPDLLDRLREFCGHLGKSCLEPRSGPLRWLPDGHLAPTLPRQQRRLRTIDRWDSPTRSSTRRPRRRASFFLGRTVQIVIVVIGAIPWEFRPFLFGNLCTESENLVYDGAGANPASHFGHCNLAGLIHLACCVLRLADHFDLTPVPIIAGSPA